MRPAPREVNAGPGPRPAAPADGFSAAIGIDFLYKSKYTETHMYLMATILIAILFISGGLMGVLAQYAWRRRAAVSAARPFAALMLCASIYSLAYALELVSPNLREMLAWSRVQYFGIAFLPAFWLVLAIHYFGRERWLSRPAQAVLFALPAAILVLQFLPARYSLFYLHPSARMADGLSILIFVPGSWYWAHIAYANAAILAGNLMYLLLLLRAPVWHRRQAAIMLAGSLAPWAGLLIYLSGRAPRGLDLGPFALILTAPLMAWGLFRLRILDILPMAREAAFEGMHDAAVVLDLDRRVVDFNSAATALLPGIGPGAIGRPAGEVFAGCPELARMIAAGQQDPLKVVCACHGRTLHLRLRLSPVVNRWGRTQGATLLVSDISETEQAQEAQREGERRFRMLFDEMTVGAALYEMVHDAQGRAVDYRWLMVNPTWEEITGFTARQVVGRTVLDVMPALDRKWIDRYDHVARTGELAEIEEFVPAIGKWIEVHAYRPAPGQVATLVSDVTERRNAAEQRRRIEFHLAHSERMEMVGRLAGGVAHDFNNLLQSILGFTELLLADQAEGAPSREDLLQIKKAAERAREITRQLLAFGRKQMLRPRQMDINEMLRDSEGVIHGLIGEDITFAARLADDLRPVRADPGQIEQVVLNIVANARQAMPDGGRLTLGTANVTLRTEDVIGQVDGRPGDFVRILIEDTGRGMDADTARHVFEPFYTTKEFGKSAGLGLATAYGIITQHGGWIQVSSAEGQGSAFQILLPALDAVAVPAAAAEPAAPPALQGRGERVLVIEDEEGVRYSTERVLQRRGYQVWSAADGRSALEVFERQQGAFDIVLCDVVLPDMNGVTLSMGLLERQPGLRVIMSSGYTDERSRYPEITRRGLLFLQKPYPPQELMRVLAEALKAPPAAPAPAADAAR